MSNMFGLRCFSVAIALTYRGIGRWIVCQFAATECTQKIDKSSDRILTATNNLVLSNSEKITVEVQGVLYARTFAVLRTSQ